VASAAAACTQYGVFRPDRGDAKKCALAHPGRNEAPAFSDELCEPCKGRSRQKGGAEDGRRPLPAHPADDEGAKVQRAEIRFDDIAGCLRTPAGGSSRQSIMIVQGSTVRSRLLSPREAARLMGLPEDYVLPENYNEAYHLVGDGVVVPVIRFLAAHILEPILASRRRAK
jgi:site-specific DNA-cytosine methylase